MKNTFKLLGIIAIAAVIGFSMAACSDDDGGNVTIKITGLTVGTNYLVSPKKDGMANNDPAIKADSEGTVSRTYSISDLKRWDFTGNCYIVYGIDSVHEFTSKNTYNMGNPATYTLDAATDFDQ
jgi:hypothetical protein